jgi:hypothetical protein
MAAPHLTIAQNSNKKVGFRPLHWLDASPLLKHFERQEANASPARPGTALSTATG